MPLTHHLWFVDTFVKMATNQIALNLGDPTPGAFKLSLLLDTITIDPSQVNPAYGTAPFDAHEPVGAGYTAGGIDLEDAVFEEMAAAAGWVRWDFSNVAWTASTITDAAGGLFHVPGLSGRAVMVRPFGAPYSTNDGQLALNFHTEGIAKSNLRAPI